VTALWLSQTAAAYTATAPPVSSVVSALQCSDVADTINAVRSDTLNLMLQVPPSGVDTLEEGACDVSAGCAADGAGVQCSGQGFCYLGMCICEDNFTGDNCENDGPPYYVHDDYCCFGMAMSDESEPPYNSIAFLWTALYPELADTTIYYGLKDSNTIAIVFEDIFVYNTADNDVSCRSTVEVLLHANGQIDIALVRNDVGGTCDGGPTTDISIGLKGPPVVEGGYDHFQFVQLVGPTTDKADIPSQMLATLDPLYEPISMPTSTPSSPSDSNSHKGSENEGELSSLEEVIIKVVVAVVAVVAVIAAVFCWRYYRSKPSQDGPYNDTKDTVFSNPIQLVSGSQ
jgi:hypothetical protein